MWPIRDTSKKQLKLKTTFSRNILCRTISSLIKMTSSLLSCCTSCINYCPLFCVLFMLQCANMDHCTLVASQEVYSKWKNWNSQQGTKKNTKQVYAGNVPSNLAQKPV